MSPSDTTSLNDTPVLGSKPLAGKPRLTKWFPEDGPQPTIPGVYEVLPDGTGPWYSFWDGHRWHGLVWGSVDEAAMQRGSGTWPRFSYRGLREDPALTPVQDQDVLATA